MKPQWNSFSASFTGLCDILYDLLPILIEKKMSKASKTVEDQLKKAILLHNDFDKLVEPIAPIEVKLPFPSSEFAEAWKLYKEYLLEDHQNYMRSRRESMMLKRLKSMSDKNEKRAIEMLEFFMANGYKNIFKPTDRQITGDDLAKIEETQQTEIIINKKVAAL